MNFLRVKQAECALADGRLDEAHELLKQDEVRSHRHGQRLATKLINAYVKRGQLHLSAGRLHEALMDCDKAGAFGGHHPEVASLRQQVVNHMEAKRQETDRHNLALGAARQNAQEGFLSRGMAMLHGINGRSTHVLQAEQEFELQHAKAEAVVERGSAALDREDWASAGHHLAEARRLRPYDKHVDELAQRLLKHATRRTKEALLAGRVDTAESLLRAVAPAVGDDLAIQELREVVSQVAKASAMLEQGHAHAAGQALRKIKNLLPGAKWIDQAILQADTIVKSRDALAAGPLGLISDGYASATRSALAVSINGSTDPGQSVPIAYHRVGHNAPRRSHDVLPKQFLIQVDGCGSALVTTSPTVMIGSVSSQQRPDIGLIADPTTPTITLRRVEDDYFLHSPCDVIVNGKPMRDGLLHDGDKIELSPRCRLRFRLPHAASTSAVIELTGARLVRGDVKRLVLLDRQLVMGAGPACQIKADMAEEPIILSVRDDRLVCRSTQAVKVGGQACDALQGTPEVPMDSPVCVGAVTFRMTQA